MDTEDIDAAIGRFVTKLNQRRENNLNFSLIFQKFQQLDILSSLELKKTAKFHPNRTLSSDVNLLMPFFRSQLSKLIFKKKVKNSLKSLDGFFLDFFHTNYINVNEFKQDYQFEDTFLFFEKDFFSKLVKLDSNKIFAS